MKTHVLVTGASRGIGKSVAEALIVEHFTVIGTARSSHFPKDFVESPLFEEVHVDLNNRTDLEHNLKKLFTEDPAAIPKVVVNNAGISEPADFEANDSEWENNWDRTLMINLKAPSLICKWAINAWREHNIQGIIINVSSRAAYRGDTEPFSSYAASKGGMVALTKSIARGCGKDGITAFSIAPGFIDTDMAAQVKEDYGPEYLKKDLAFDEITQPEEVAKLIAFLAQGKGKHMTGQTFHINGGSYLI
jgi:NAD(P)-dependent dehydrogenase (short-subunit alcohol dehydrogenase family)